MHDVPHLYNRARGAGGVIDSPPVDPATSDDYVYLICPGTPSFPAQVTDLNGNVWRLRGSARFSPIADRWGAALYRCWTSNGSSGALAQMFDTVVVRTYRHPESTSSLLGQYSDQAAQVGSLNSTWALEVLTVAYDIAASNTWATDPAPPPLTLVEPAGGQDGYFDVNGDRMRVYEGAAGRDPVTFIFHTDEVLGNVDFSLVTFGWVT